MAVTRYDLEKIQAEQRSPDKLGFEMGVDPLVGLDMDPVATAKEDAKKISPPAPWAFDTLNMDPNTLLQKPSQIDVLAPKAAQKDLSGWGGMDTITSAKSEPTPAYVPPLATSDASRGPSASWLNMIGGTYNAAVNTVYSLWSAKDAKPAKVESKPQVAEADSTGVAGWVQELYTKLLDGFAQMGTSVWYLVAGAQQAFDNGERSYVIPETNPDGTANVFAGREITPHDLKELARFQEDSKELMDLLSKLEGKVGIEMLMILLMKTLAKDKEEEFEYLQAKLQKTYRELDFETKARFEKVEELSKKIKDNHWYEWFQEATAHSTLAMTGVILLPAAATAGGWGVFAVIGAIALGTAGLLDSKIGVYSGMANAWSKTIGEDSQQARASYHKTIKDGMRWVSAAASLAVPMFGIQVGGAGTLWSFGGTLGGTLTNAVNQASGHLGALPRVGAAIGNAFTTYGGAAATALGNAAPWLQNTMNTIPGLQHPFITKVLPHAAIMLGWISKYIGTYCKTSSQVTTGEMRGDIDFRSDKIKMKEQSIDSTLKALNKAFKNGVSDLYKRFSDILQRNADLARQVIRRN